MLSYRVTYTYTDDETDIVNTDEAGIREAIHQGLMRPSVDRFTVEKL